MQVPPVFGIDSMHGANYVKDAVMYPHALHAAASFNTQHAWNAARSAARHTRASGIGWVFAPVLDLPMASGFPRVYESSGEDPALIAAMGTASVQGLQVAPLPHIPTLLETRTGNRQYFGDPFASTEFDPWKMDHRFRRSIFHGWISERLLKLWPANSRSLVQ